MYSPLSYACRQGEAVREGQENRNLYLAGKRGGPLRIGLVWEQLDFLGLGQRCPENFRNSKAAERTQGLGTRRKPELLSWLDLNSLCGLMQNLPFCVLVCLSVKWAGCLIDIEGPFFK